MKNHGSWILAGVLVMAWYGAAFGSSWSLPLGGSAVDAANAVQQTADGGYIVAGSTGSFGAGGNDAWVVKLNADGAVVWQNTYGGGGDDRAASIQQTADGGYIVACQTTSYGAGGPDAWVLKLNANGAVTWQKTYGGTADDFATSVRQTADGGYIVAGITNSSGAGGYDAWVLKLNASGAVAWQKTYGGTANDTANSVRQTADGGYIVAGQTSSYGGGSANAWVVKLNPDGSVAWQKSYGGISGDYAGSVQQTADGGYVVAGSTFSFGKGNADAWVLKLNADGTVAWQKAYGSGGNDFANSVQQTADGGYIVAGQTFVYDSSSLDEWVLKLNADGAIAWQKTYGGSGSDAANSVQQTVEGGFIVAGYTNSYGAGNSDAWVMKLDQNGGIMDCSAVAVGTWPTDTTVTSAIPLDSSAVAAATSITTANATAAAATSSATATKNCSFVTSSTKWYKTYGGTADDSAISARQTADGGYIVTGYTSSHGAGNNDVWVLKLNADGSVAWQKTYGGAGTDIPASLRQTTDGGYIVAGWTSSFTAGNTEVWVLKLNADGSVDWQKTYGGAGSDYAYSIEQTADGGYVVAGQTSSFGAGNSDALVLKLYDGGEVDWQQVYGGTGSDSATSIQQTGDGGYIFTGKTDSYGAGGYDIWAVKLDAYGSIAWEKTYGGAGDDIAGSVQQTADGGYIVAGYTSSWGAGNDDAWVLKLDADGSIAWQKTYGGSDDDLAGSVQQTADGGYVVAGYTLSYAAGNKDAWVLKLDSTGAVVWQKTYGGTGDDIAASVQQTADGGYMVAGNTTSSGAGGRDAWVLKLDQQGGITGCGKIGTSGAVPQNSVATVSIPVIISSAPSATVSDTSATVTTTSVTPATTCSASYADYLLNLIFQGNGTGRVTSSPSGLNCTADCGHSFTSGTTVSLTATPDSLAAPGGWSGACNASGQVTMTSDKSCTLNFTTPADFSGTPRVGVVPFVVDFNDASTVTGPSAWQWDFGDGTTGSGLAASHIYNDPGLYTVSLQVTGSGGTAKARKGYYITAAPSCASRGARIAGPLYYGTIMEAYALLIGTVIDLQAMEFAEDVVMTNAKTVNLTAGYACDFGTIIGNAVINGSLTVGGYSGPVTVGGITIR